MMIGRPQACRWIVLVTAWLLLSRADQARAEEDLLLRVCQYADCLIEHGQDTYGAVQTPLFAEALDRKTLRLLEGDALKQAAALKFEQWGIRPHDRMLTGGNPQHCEDFYQALYALSDVTGDQKYGSMADRSLRWFFEHCQSPGTGLLYWGEHSGWDFLTDAQIREKAGNTHEFYRPWILWDRSWDLAPEACRKFALGLWENQIGDHQSGDYSRHAAIDRPGAGRGAPYPRHGGFYIYAWAKAYQHAHDPVFLKAIEVVLGGLDNDRRHGGMVVGGSREKGTRVTFDVSIAVSVWEAAELVPDELAAKLRRFAKVNDEGFQSAEGDSRVVHAAAKKGDNLWASGYGFSGGQQAGFGNLCVLRHQQVKLDVYRRHALAVAEKYRVGEIDLSFPVHPGTVGQVILLLVSAHDLTGDQTYLDRADHLAQQAARLFLTDGCPLPRATHMHEHYEAITGADTLMMSFLQLWAARQIPPKRPSLVFTDR